MKFSNIFKLTAFAGVMLAMTGCSEDKVLTVDQYGIPEVGNYTINVQVDPETNTFTLRALDQNGQDIKGAYPIWRVYANARNPETPSARSTNQVLTGVIKTKGEYPVELQIGNRNGISEGVRTGTIVIDKDLADPNKFYGYKYDSEFNLWKTANVGLASTWFANNDWGEIAAPAIDVANDGFEFHTPADMGGQQWQGQVHVFTDIEVSSAETYDFSIYIEAQVDSKVTVKVQKDGDDGVFFSEAQQEFKAGGSVWHFEDQPGFDGTLKIAFDFGGNPDMDFAVSHIVFKNHKNDDGTVWPAEGGDEGEEGEYFGGFNYNSDVNLWKAANVTLESTWFANNDWGELNPQPDVDLANDYMFVHAPAEMGGSQWQGQVHVMTDIQVSADKKYDFSCHVNVPAAGKATIKVQKAGDDDTMFAGMGDQKTLKAGDNVIYFIDQPGFDGTLKIAFDFGGMADMDIEVTDIVFKDASADDGTAKPEAPVSWDADRNLWAAGNISLESTWFANNDWGEITAPAIDLDNDYMFFHAPAEMGGSQWQGQVHVMTDIEVSAANNYDFKCVVNVPADGKVTVKVQKAGDDDTMFEGMGDQIPVKAGKNTIKFTNKPGFDGTLKIAYDFGGMADMDIEVTETHFQVHQ